MKKIVPLFLAIGLAALYFPAHAQLNPLGSLYFQNQYLYNPAMAGVDNSLNLNAAVKGQWTNIEGAPLSQALTADYGVSSKVGLGLLLNSEQLGVFQRSRAMVTYAYHLPLNDEDRKLRFGLSLGLMHKWIDRSKVIGDDDEVINTFNLRPLSLDFDFGMAYTSKRLTIQGAVPNLPRVFNRDLPRNTVDLPLFFSAISYKANLLGAMDYIEPKVAFRKVQYYNSLWDVGARFSFSNDKLGLDAIYRSSKSLIIGVGTTYRESLSIQLLFTSNPSQLGSHGSGEYELALKYSLKRKE